MIEPYTYVRAVTLGLGTVWTVGGLVRTVRFHRRWRNRLEPLGFGRRWLGLQVRTFVLRVTLLDPVNLALTLLLLGIWAFRWLLATRFFPG